MPFIQRDNAGNIVGTYANEQPGLAEEWVEEEIEYSPTLTRAQVEAARLSAYAHPITGSDRFIAEAYCERLVGNEEGAIAAEKNLEARRSEIQRDNPWPVEI